MSRDVTAAARDDVVPRQAGGVSPSAPHGDAADTRPSAGGAKTPNIVDLGDEEIKALAEPLWLDLLKCSNEGKYGEFVKNFSNSFALAMNQVVVGHQFANSALARNLSEATDFLGIIRRGEHVTVLFRQRSTKAPGEWLGRLVLGHENGKVRIFGASIF